MQPPRLKDKRTKRPNEPYELGCIPNSIICNMAKWLVYYFSIGKADISGEDWGDIFSKAIGGEHLNSPLGLADVVLDGMAWSVKSVKHEKPHSCRQVRIISGRCSPDYSYGITDPHADVQATGTAVLGIWNERINIARDNFDPLRSCLLIRNPNTLEFCLHEYELHRYITSEFIWSENKNGNLVGTNIKTSDISFTWQPHGAQFTIHHRIPTSAKMFSIKRPPVLDFNRTLKEIGFADDWVKILN